MLRIASVCLALALSASMSFAAAELTGRFEGTVNPAPDQGQNCFTQTSGSCGGTFVSAIISQLAPGGAICGAYPAGGARSRAADEFICSGAVNGLHWYGTYFNLNACVPLGAAANFNHIFTLGGTACPDDAFIFCTLSGVPVIATNIGPNSWEYRSKFQCAGGIPSGIPIYVTTQINETAFPQWGWGESAQNLVGGFPCLIAPDLAVNAWTPIPGLVGRAWCGQAMDVQMETATPVENSTWGAVKNSFYN
jgi:hypothetical protein